MSGEVVHGFWVAVLHVVGELLMYVTVGRSKVWDGVPQHEVKTVAIANDNRLGFGQAAHIECRDLGAKGAVDVKHASVVHNAIVDRAVIRVVTGYKALEVGSVLQDNRSGGGRAWGTNAETEKV